jgi:hypothetical protein
VIAGEKFVMHEKVQRIALPLEGVVAGREKRLWRQMSNTVAMGKCAIEG